MSDLSEFIREIIRHNDLLNEDELGQGDVLLSQDSELNLAQVLVSQKMLTAFMHFSDLRNEAFRQNH